MSALPRRNHLAWIDAAAWRAIEARCEEPQAREILAHWRSRGLPLVVARQREGLTPGAVALGLPAPLRWGRRRLALEVPRQRVERTAPFPCLRQVALHDGWDRGALALDEALQGLGASCHVYGSHGWQYLSGEAYLTEHSDIDISVEVGDLPTARAAVRSIQAAPLHRRVDGEIVFPTGVAVAWQELARMLAGQVQQVLVKGLHGPLLADLEELRRMSLAAAVEGAAAMEQG